jgi:hypothetical protein
MQTLLVHHIGKKKTHNPSYILPDHSLAPWSVSFRDFEDDKKDWYVVSEDGNPIVKVFDHESPKCFGRWSAHINNLRLITAAPDLLFFAQVVLEANISHAINEFAKETIEKATKGKVNGL